MKKMFVTGLAILTVVGISIPVIASSVLKGNIRVDDSVGTNKAVEWEQEVINAQPAAAAGAEINAADSVPEVAPAGGICSYYVDANGDGICDHCVGTASSVGSGTCEYYADANGDGLCDHCVAAAPAGNGGCGYYTDVDGDGICDHCVAASAPAGNGGCGYYTDADGDGICDHCVAAAAPAGNGGCGYYTDANGDGICDHCVGGSGSGQQSQRGHHGGGHHGGGHHRW